MNCALADLYPLGSMWFKSDAECQLAHPFGWKNGQRSVPGRRRCIFRTTFLSRVLCFPREQFILVNSAAGEFEYLSRSLCPFSHLSHKNVSGPRTTWAKSIWKVRSFYFSFEWESQNAFISSRWSFKVDLEQLMKKIMLEICCWKVQTFELQLPLAF